MPTLLLALLVAVAQPPDLDAVFRRADAKGAALVLDAKTGRVVASGASAGRDVSASVLPLSVIKLYLAAVWWDHGLDGSLDDMLVEGRDQPGRDRAVALRKRIGGAKVLDDLRRYGLDSLALAEDADDATWGLTLSIGEQHVTVTLLQVSRFLRAVAVSRSDTARKLQSAMRKCVTRGTARAVAARQAGARWQLAGKTGTGPANSRPYDGWFAGLIFLDGEPRYTVAVYLERRGPGGGVAASIAADIAAALAQQRR